MGEIVVVNVMAPSRAGSLLQLTELFLEKCNRM